MKSLGPFDTPSSFTNSRSNIIYLVSSRPYIEICRVCKICGRRGGAEPSIYFTDLTYFYVRSGTDQISVLFRRGTLFVYAVLRKIRKFIRTADKITTSILARKCDVASCATSHYDVIDTGMKVKAYFEVLWVRKSRQKQHYLVVRYAWHVKRKLLKIINVVSNRYTVSAQINRQKIP